MDLEIPEGTRIIIIEGIAGSGKDTLQEILKEKFKDKIIHNYTEGEVLFSWKHARIKNIAHLRFSVMKALLKSIEQMLAEEPDSVCLLNRFHLSLYVAHVRRGEIAEAEYSKLIEHLKRLPIHILLLTLDKDEIEKRSAHIERSDSWKKHQQRMIKEEGFTTQNERYIVSQRLMLESAKRDTLPFSTLSLS